MSSYYSGASLIFVVVDPTQPGAVTQAEHWISDLSRHTDTCHVAFVVNKIDLRPDLLENGWEGAKIILAGLKHSQRM